MIKVLYITYDGLTDSLGQSQVLSYLKRFNQQEISVEIISFEKKEIYAKNAVAVQKDVDATTLVWHKLSYTKFPPIFSTLYDIVRGLSFAARLQKRSHFDIVHCRGYIPSLIGMYLKKWYGLKFIFDMRGWWVDEKMESGHWNGFIYKQVYKAYKKIEKALFRHSDFVVSLTYAGQKEIIKQGLKTESQIGVIPTCVDFEIFKAYNEKARIEVRQELGIPLDAAVMIHSGAIGGSYSCLDIKKVFQHYSEAFPGAYLLILSKEQLPSELEILSDIKNVLFKSVPFKEVHRYLGASDLGFVFYKISFSVIGRSPTKLGEYWACGVPVVSYKGIGDLEYIFDRYPASGVLIDLSELTSDVFKKDFLKNPDKIKLRQNSLDYFDVEKGKAFYEQVYRQLANKKI
jgi:glycosyltransferase involved in cell wall biosynthesis